MYSDYIYVLIHIIHTVVITGHVKGTDCKYNMFNMSKMYRQLNRWLKVKRKLTLTIYIRNVGCNTSVHCYCAFLHGEVLNVPKAGDLYTNQKMKKSDRGKLTNTAPASLRAISDQSQNVRNIVVAGIKEYII